MNEFSIPRIYDADGDLSRQWYVYYSYRNPETKKNERFRIAISRALKTRSARYEKASQLKAELKQKLIRGFNPFEVDKKKGTNAIEAINYALKLKVSTNGKRTKYTYNSVVRKFMEWLSRQKIHNKPIETINFNVADRYSDHLIINEKISNRTFNNRITALRTIFNLLVKKGYLDVNPFNSVDTLPIREPEISAFTTKELKLISERLPDDHYQLWVISQFVFYCFIRPAELVRLQFKNIKWEKQIVDIPGLKSKNGKSATVFIPDRMKENLKGWDRNWPDEYYLFSNGIKLTPGNKEIAPTRIANAWRPLAKKYGIHKNIYDLKHTGNGFADDCGISLRDIQLQNRHHSLEQTQEYFDKFRRRPGNGFMEKFTGF